MVILPYHILAQFKQLKNFQHKELLFSINSEEQRTLWMLLIFIYVIKDNFQSWLRDGNTIGNPLVFSGTM